MVARRPIPWLAVPGSRFISPRATVLVPVFNEASTIEDCLEALAAQDIGACSLQVLVVDGTSTDGTADIARRFVELRRADPRFDHWEVIVNEGRSRPANLNRGLQAAICPVVCRVDARSRVPAHYIRTCCTTLERRPEVVVVGGRQRAAGGATVTSLGIARAVNNRWGMGGAKYRRATIAGPVDTVYLGAFRTDQVRTAGGWDVELAVNEDFELNRRMRSQGLVWFDPTLEVTYLPRSSLGALATQYWLLGRGKARYLRRSGDRPQPRQLGAAAALPAAALASGIAMLNRRSRPYALVLGGTALAGVELLGAATPPGPPAVHVLSAAATVVMAGSWVAGMWAELLSASEAKPAAARAGRTSRAMSQRPPRPTTWRRVRTTMRMSRARL
jgi:succinoglycan biosynthesis protein ExoA